MTIFTVYFCGTSATRFDANHADYFDGELVSTLANNTQGHEFAEWIILDGPGSGNLQADEMTVKTDDHPYFGVALGKGWESNVEHARNMMKGSFDWKRTQLTQEQYDQLKKDGVPIGDVEDSGSFLWRNFDYGERKVSQQDLQQQLVKTHRKGAIIPTQVNMVGWSRGGISCHMLANAMLLDKELRDIPVNIFTIDPVPGPLNFQIDKTRLGANVREYVGFYARDERSRTFASVVPMTQPETRISIFPMPGRHATLAGNASSTGAQGPAVVKEPGRMVRHFAETCLTRWGVKLDKQLGLTDADLLAAHTRMQADEPIYTAMQGHTYLGVAEEDGGQRRVVYGEQTTRFDKVSGPQWQPQTGLATGLDAGIEHYRILSS